MSVLFTEPVLVEFTNGNGVLNRVICVTHNSNGFKVEQSGTQTISGMSGIRCLSRNRVLVKRIFFESKKFWREAPEKTVFHLKTPGGRNSIVSFHPQHIHIFLQISIFHNSIKRIDRTISSQSQLTLLKYLLHTLTSATTTIKVYSKQPTWPF